MFTYHFRCELYIHALYILMGSNRRNTSRSKRMANVSSRSTSGEKVLLSSSSAASSGPPLCPSAAGGSGGGERGRARAVEVKIPPCRDSQPVRAALREGERALEGGSVGPSPG
jgi:hypothetical protein